MSLHFRNSKYVILHILVLRKETGNTTYTLVPHQTNYALCEKVIFKRNSFSQIRNKNLDLELSTQKWNQGAA